MAGSFRRYRVDAEEDADEEFGVSTELRWEVRGYYFKSQVYALCGNFPCISLYLFTTYFYSVVLCLTLSLTSCR